MVRRIDLVKYFPEGKIPYPSQMAALDAATDFLADSNKKLAVMIIPTAGGKSPIATAIARGWLSERAGPEYPGAAVILCINKSLQNQYRKEFVGEISVVQGASEFRCVSDPRVTCGSEQARVQCESRATDEYGSSECPYQQHRLEAAALLHNRPAVFNPHSFQAFKRHPRLKSALPGSGGIMIVDEAHQLPNQLRDFLTISLPLDQINNFMDPSAKDSREFCFMSTLFTQSNEVTPGAKNTDGLPVGVVNSIQLMWIEALGEAIAERRELCAEAVAGDKARLKKVDPKLARGSDDEIQSHLHYLTDQVGKIEQLVSMFHQSQWVVEFERHKSRDDRIQMTIKPVTIPERFLNDFFSGFDKVCLMSGTIFDSHLEELGLTARVESADDITFFQCPSRIPAPRRAVYVDVHNGRGVNHRNLRESFEHFVRVIVDRVTPKLPGERGIIHVSSHAQASLLCKLGNMYAREVGKKGSPPAVFMSSSEKGWKATYEEFLKTPRGNGHPNVYLVAARRFEGVNLKNDLARISIIAKAPYPFTMDTMIQALNAKFNGYIDTQTMTSFIQASNRTTRGPDDWSLNIALDTNLLNLLSRFNGSCPEYFQEQIVIPDEPDWLDSYSPPGD
jgi:Rad3-related DNA helicase